MRSVLNQWLVDYKDIALVVNAIIIYYVLDKWRQRFSAFSFFKSIHIVSVMFVCVCEMAVYCW